jgi:hypothetical protein
MKPPVLTKVDFVRRYQVSEFGNRAPTWDNIEEFLQSQYRGLVHIRNRAAGGPTWYDVPAENVMTMYYSILDRNKATEKSLYFSGMAPTEKTTFQGEVVQSTNYLDLFYSHVPLPMRGSLLQGGRQVSGLKALWLMKTYMDPSSFDWVQELLEEYPGHVIEFSCYSANWGTVPHRNTVIWEVRGGY